MSARSRIPAHAAPPRRPRWWRVAVLAASISLGALPASAQVPVPPAGAVVVVVMQSDGMALLPVGVAAVPPLACVPGGAP